MHSRANMLHDSMMMSASTCQFQAFRPEPLEIGLDFLKTRGTSKATDARSGQIPVLWFEGLELSTFLQHPPEVQAVASKT